MQIPTRFNLTIQKKKKKSRFDKKKTPLEDPEPKGFCQDFVEELYSEEDMAMID